MSVRYSAVIFDLDGTLLDTLEDIAIAANEVLQRFDQPTHSIDRYRTLVGDGVTVLFQRAWPATLTDARLSQQAVAAFQEIYADQWYKRSKPYDGIETLLNRLNAVSLPLAVLSNKPDPFTQECVRHFLGLHRFASVHGQKAGVPRKPDPTAVRQIARELQVRTEDIAFVGDTNTDMETAVSSGCGAIGVSWGFRAVSELRQSGAQEIFDTPQGLGDFLLA